jgi:hypothetical protein
MNTAGTAMRQIARHIARKIVSGSPFLRTTTKCHARLAIVALYFDT